MTTPSISVIIPCGRMAQYLADAVGSVMRQTLPVMEILVIHPASDEATRLQGEALKAEGAPLALLHDPETGPGPARNVGLEIAEGELIAFLDADDIWPIHKLEKQVNRLNGAIPVDAVGGLLEMFDQLEADGVSPKLDPTAEAQALANPGMLMCRRTVFDRIGAFDPDFLYAEDIDLLMRLRDFDVPFTVLNETLLYYRQHSASMMKAQNPRMISDFRRAAFKSVVRRRKMGLPPETRQVLTGYIESGEEPPA